MSDKQKAGVNRARLSRKQEAFVREYDACNGNGTQAARKAGYQGNANVLGVQANRLLRDSRIKSQIAQLDAEIAAHMTPNRVKRRLDEISHHAQDSGQFGPAVRAEELIGKSLGMWVDQSIQLAGVLKDEHVAALIEIARARQAKPVDLSDSDEDR